jgi:hypothetical protein
VTAGWSSSAAISAMRARSQACAGPGNQISEDAQENKLRLVGEVADRVWGF